MRILVVTPWYPTEDAPESGIFVAREASALAERHDVGVLFLDWSGRRHRQVREMPSVRTHRLPLQRLNPVAYARARRAVRRAASSADVVHTHALTGLIPWIVGRPTRDVWVHSEHWSALAAPQTATVTARLALRALRTLLRRPAVVVAESQRLAAAVRPLRCGPTIIVPCVVPESAVTERPDDAFALIGIGGLIPRKQPILAIETVAELRRRGLPAHLTWVGTGPLQDAVMRTADELSITPFIALTGAIPSNEVFRHLDAASMLLLPTLADNFCVVAAEALTRGRPVVSGAATGAVDYALPSVSRFVAVQTASAYADAVQDLAAATSDVSANDVARTVAGRFTPDAVRTALESAYAAAGATP